VKYFLAATAAAFIVTGTALAFAAGAAIAAAYVVEHLPASEDIDAELADLVDGM